MFGDGPGTELNVRKPGIPVCVIVRVLPASGSVAVAVVVAIAVFSAPLAVAGALIAGGVLPLDERAPSQSNQSPGIPLVRPHGSAGSPTTYVFGNAFPSHSVPKPVPNPKGLIVEAPIWT